MFAFILRRLFQALVVMVVVAYIAFLLFQYVGDPVVFLLGQDATPQQIRELRSALGLDQPFFVQFWHFLLNAVQGEFGLSLRQGAKVSRLISERFPATFELAVVAALLALLLGIPMGVYAALRRGSFTSQLFMTLSLLGVSLPTFLVGILLILLFSVTLGWFPSFGRGETVQVGWWQTGLLTRDGWHHIGAAGAHAGGLPAHADHAARCARRMLEVPAHRLHQVRPRARPADPAIHFGHA
jgi:peptide/nickel transport system permease protein